MGNYKSETERKAELQEKAISIRDYMQEPDTMRQLMAALPKWLAADRFIRLFYSAMMKNASLMLCTKQSLLSSMIEAAQIGLEPVLGKAALIPYGKEVQFQPMYKGLMEVARRSADIIITGHVVYECDEFDIEWGDNERLHHKPKFGPDREKSAKIGAYDIWKVGGVVRSRRFMTTAEVLYIRDNYSNPWKKSGKNSIWGKHENDMFLKTVIKKHCNMEPQSVEMERAVELDNRVELGRSQLGMGRIDELPMPTAFDFETPEEGQGPGKPGEPPAKPPADIVKVMAAQSNIPEKDIKEFIVFIAKKQEKSVQWVEENALKSPESFIRAVQVRLDTLKGGRKEAGEKPKVETGSDSAGNGMEKPDMIEWLRMKRPSTSVKNAQEWLKVYEAQAETINFLEDRTLRDQLQLKKEKTEKFLSVATTTKEKVSPSTKSDPLQAENQDGARKELDSHLMGADEEPPFKNPFEGEGEGGAEEKPLTSTEQMGDDIRKAKTEEVDLIARYENSVESVMKFDKSGIEYTLDDFEKFMMEMAHREGLTFSSFQCDVMRSHQFPDYFDKFISRISEKE